MPLFSSQLSETSTIPASYTCVVTIVFYPAFKSRYRLQLGPLCFSRLYWWNTLSAVNHWLETCDFHLNRVKFQ
ncbi:hypothetical protein L1887_10995 [Cichorium endivia]|nr:hypothetical protein L1887_10995 [Cichorium endivia]